MEQYTAEKTVEIFIVEMTDKEACEILSQLDHLPDGPIGYGSAMAEFYKCLCKEYK